MTSCDAATLGRGVTTGERIPESSTSRVTPMTSPFGEVRSPEGILWRATKMPSDAGGPGGEVLIGLSLTKEMS